MLDTRAAATELRNTGDHPQGIEHKRPATRPAGRGPLQVTCWNVTGIPTDSQGSAKLLDIFHTLTDIGTDVVCLVETHQHNHLLWTMIKETWGADCVAANGPPPTWRSTDHKGRRGWMGVCFVALHGDIRLRHIRHDQRGILSVSVTYGNRLPFAVTGVYLPDDGASNQAREPCVDRTGARTRWTRDESVQVLSTSQCRCCHPIYTRSRRSMPDATW